MNSDRIRGNELSRIRFRPWNAPVIPRTVRLSRHHQSPGPKTLSRICRTWSRLLRLAVGMQRLRVERYWITRRSVLSPRSSGQLFVPKGDARCTPNMKIIFPFGTGMIDIYSRARSAARSGLLLHCARGSEISFGWHCARKLLDVQSSKRRSLLYGDFRTFSLSLSLSLSLFLSVFFLLFYNT